MIAGLTFDQFMLLLCGYFGAMIGLLILMKLRSRGKLRILELRPNLHYKVRQVSTDGNKIKMSKENQPTFEPPNIFEEEKPAWKFWRNPKRLALIVEGASKALGWKNNNPDSEEFSELSHLWNRKEVKKFIKKEVLKARMESKPMSNTMFILLIILLMFNLFLSFLMANRIGIF